MATGMASRTNAQPMPTKSEYYSVQNILTSSYYKLIYQTTETYVTNYLKFINNVPEAIGIIR